MRNDGERCGERQTRDAGTDETTTLHG